MLRSTNVVDRSYGVPLLSALIVLLGSVAKPAEPVAGGSLRPEDVPRFAAPLVIPPAMPRATKIPRRGAKNVDYYEIAVRQFEQQILPAGLPPTTVWGYGAPAYPGTVAEGGSFNYPSFTIEAKYGTPVRVKWINDLVDTDGSYLPHLLPADQTLHWANPAGPRDHHGMEQSPYVGPVPMVVHVHGAHTHEESDGYPEAWYLPAASDIPPEIAFRTGTFYEQFRQAFLEKTGVLWEPGTATFEYPNDQRATTLWYHDHTLGLTRLNVYAGPAGFYLLRGGPDDEVLDRRGRPAVLPSPSPALGDAVGIAYYEIPIAIQDRSFNADGSLFYPDNRAFFEGLEPDELRIQFAPDSDIAPIWNPEFFGNMMVVNGRTWPYLDVEQRRYRFRLLNGCDSRFLILRLEGSGAPPFWQIGVEGGFLPGPVRLEQLLMAPAERADVIVDFSAAEAGETVTLVNLGPDEPFGGGVPGEDFEPADPESTGIVMQFRVVARHGPDRTTPPEELVLPKIERLPAAENTRRLSLNETESEVVCVLDVDGTLVQVPCSAVGAEVFGPAAALLGTLDGDGSAVPLLWADAVTEDPAVGATEVWEVYNFTADAHPIHIHLVQFEVVDRQQLVVDEDGDIELPAELVPDTDRPPEPWESGFKDTVIAYPGEVTRIKARFDLAGLFVWHCHILEHEDNEMMRPYRVGPAPKE